MKAWDSAWTGRLLLLVSGLLFLGYSLQFFSYAEDDAFIPMRYALNFWRGVGWVMNPGERVEGCTSPLHLAFVTLLIRFLTPDQTLWFSKIFGLLIGLAVLWQAGRLGRLLFPQTPWLGSIASLVIALRPEFALAMTNGLETGLATLLLTAGMTAFIQACRQGSEGNFSHASLLFVGAALARPELTLTFPLLLAGAWVSGLRSRKSITSLTLYLAPLLFFFGLRLAYYGSFVPNTYWAKQMPMAQSVPLGLAYLGRFAVPGGLFVGLALYGLGLFAALRHGGQARLALPLALGLHVLFLLRSGGDWMIDGRFFMVILPLCAVVWLGAVQTLFDLAAWAAPRRKSLAYAVVSALAGFTLLAQGKDSLRRADGLARQPGMTDVFSTLGTHAPLEEWKVGNHDGRLAVGHWITDHARPGQLVLISEMGLATVINPNVRFLDMRGLTDRKIARMNGYPRDLSGVQGEREWMDASRPLGRYIRERRPEWVALLWDVYQCDQQGVNAANDLYIPSGVFPIHCDGRTLTVATWRRRDVTP